MKGSSYAKKGKLVLHSFYIAEHSRLLRSPCALPALFVVLGMGATFAGLVSNVPQLIWISENKAYFFGFGAIALSIGGYLQWRARTTACPIDPKLREACSNTRDWSFWVYLGSVALYLIGAAFAYILPRFLA